MEKEIDCDADELALLRADAEKAQLEGRSWSMQGYRMQEIEGIGGVVKKKVKKRVKVGQVVKEYEDERDNGGYLSREQTGQNRSWCSWCERVVVGKKDVDNIGDNDLDRTVSSSSSMSST